MNKGYIQPALQSIKEGRIVKGFKFSTYMNRLFPDVFQQKPGADYYGAYTSVLFFIVIYFVMMYDNLAAAGPFEEKGIFRGDMVIMLLA